MNMTTYREGWLMVNEVPSRVQTWGGWVEDPLPEDDCLVVFIPGNPGLTPFYHSFLAALHQQLGVPVWVTCHAGHEMPPRSSQMKLPEDPNFYNLAGQVAHKMAFLKQYVPANRKIYLIGHSMGSKVISELLKDKQIAEHTDKCYLLMPTLERIGETPNGKFFTSILSYLHSESIFSVIIFFAWIFSLFPERARVFLIGCWFILSRQHRVDEPCMDATCHLCLPKVLSKVLSLGRDEIARIKELDMEVLNAHGSKLKVYFARSDGWAPLAFMDSLKQAKPELDVTVLGEQFSHAFVLDNPDEMADILADQIKKQRLIS